MVVLLTIVLITAISKLECIAVFQYNLIYKKKKVLGWIWLLDCSLPAPGLAQSKNSILNAILSHSLNLQILLSTFYVPDPGLGTRAKC